MKVEAKFMCPELVGPVESGIYEVPEGTDVLGLLAHARRKCELPEQEDLKDHLIFLRNTSPATGDTLVQDADKVLFLRRIYGG